MILLFAALGIVYAQAPTRPTLPQKTVILTLPKQGTSTCPTLTTGSNCIRNVPAGNSTSLRNAINAATCGDTIVLVAGSTYSGNFTIPSTSCSGWIVIESSAVASLPSPGNRVGPSNASDMAIISTPNSSSAIQFNANSNHWRIIGCEITTSVSNSSGIVYYLVAMGETITSLSQLPSYIIFDRTYIYGSAVTPIQHGIGMDGAFIGVVDSYCDEIVDSGADSQCLFAYNGSGPFLIQNNFLQATGENIMFGGADPAITNLIPSDITVIGNLFQKNVAAWRGVISDVKDLFELKNAQRVLLDGNVLQYTWAAGQSESIIIRSVDQQGSCSWCVAQDVTITHNLIQHVPQGIELVSDQSCAAEGGCLPTVRVLVRNNVFVDVSPTNWGGSHGQAVGLQGDGGPYTMHDVTVDHNTAFQDNITTGPPYNAFVYFNGGGVVVNIQFTNNLSNYGTNSSGGYTGDTYYAGTQTFEYYTSNLTYNDDVLINVSGSSNGYPPYPSGTYWNTTSGVGFTNYPGGNYQLTSSSPYYQAGTDGKDIGVWDWTCLNNDSTAALVGTFVPGPGGCALSGNLQ